MPINVVKSSKGITVSSGPKHLKFLNLSFFSRILDTPYGKLADKILPSW
jgi:hypothetical protein